MEGFQRLKILNIDQNKKDFKNECENWYIANCLAKR